LTVVFRFSFSIFSFAMYSLYPYPIFRRIFFPILKLFIKQVKGLENLPEKGPYIIAANHGGSLDGYFLASLVIPRIKGKVHFFARQAKYGSFLGNWIARHWAGCILVDPNSKAKTVEEATNFLKKKRVVAIFPEGVSHHDNCLQEGKTGLARIVIRNKVSVIPVGISTNMPTVFEKAFFQTFFLLKGRISFSIGEPITFYEYYQKPADKELLKEITRRIMKEIGKLVDLPYNY